MKKLRKIVICLLSILTFAGCDGVDCPLNNIVYSTWGFYADGSNVTIDDTIYVYAKVKGVDTLLINQLYNASSMNIPLSYYQQADTFTLEIHQYVDSASYDIFSDQIIINKEDLAHFNSPECGVWHEHNIKEVNNTTTIIDSIQVVRQIIDTNEQENFRIHFK